MKKKIKPAREGGKIFVGLADCLFGKHWPGISLNSVEWARVST